MYYKKLIALFLVSLLVAACKHSSHSADLQSASTSSTDTQKIFRMPEIPVMLATPVQRTEYLAHHFWDSINPADTTILHHPEELEQAWADYCDLLHHIPLQLSQEVIKDFFLSLEKEMKVYTSFKSLAEKYLDDPNSPLRSEEIYIPVLEAMTHSSFLGEMDKLRPRARLQLAMKNRVGIRAADFTYTLATGKQHTLGNIRTDYTLIFFNNPGCEACAATLGGLKSSPVIGRLLEEGRLTILAMYTDEELEEWHRHLPDFPAEWINAYDRAQVIRTKQLYDLRAIPTLHLLDKDKTVLLKDAPLDRVVAYLESGYIN